MTASPTPTTDARELARRFVDAFNERDEATLRDLVAEDAELRTLSGPGLRGHDGLQTLLRTAAERDLRLVPLRPPAVERDGDGVRVTIPIRELIGPDDIERTAEIHVRDGRIVAFAVRPFIGS
jgi:ketosteroid isomerase-like protein